MGVPAGPWGVGTLPDSLTSLYPWGGREISPKANRGAHTRRKKMNGQHQEHPVFPEFLTFTRAPAL